MNQQIDVTVEHGGLIWTRKGMMGRQLFHLGGRAFYPGGAPAARIRFREEGAAMLMAIEDPEVILVARRKQEQEVRIFRGMLRSRVQRATSLGPTPRAGLVRDRAGWLAMRVHAGAGRR